jgi:hypothetical protein
MAHHSLLLLHIMTCWVCFAANANDGCPQRADVCLEVSLTDLVAAKGRAQPAGKVQTLPMTSSRAKEADAPVTPPVETNGKCTSTQRRKTACRKRKARCWHGGPRSRTKTAPTRAGTECPTGSPSAFAKTRDRRAASKTRSNAGAARCCAASCRRRPKYLIDPTARQRPEDTEKSQRFAHAGSSCRSSLHGAARFFCAHHAPADATLLKSPSQLCQYRCGPTNSSSSSAHTETQCTRWPSYGDPVERRARFCREHAGLGHVNLKARHCQMAECTRQATYGEAGAALAVFCVQHKVTRRAN